MMHRRHLMRLGYVAVVLFATYAQPDLPVDAAISRVGGALDPALGARAFLDAIRNVLLFVGWGAVWTIAAPRGNAWPIVLGATLWGLLLSATVEGIQLLSPSRTPSVLDLATNTIGSFTGALATAVLIVMLRAARGRRSYVGVPMFVFAGGYGLAAALEAVSPLLRQVRMALNAPTALERVSIALHNIIGPFTGFLVTDIVLFAPVGFLAVAAMAEFTGAYRRAAAWVAVCGMAASIVCELARAAGGFLFGPGAILAHSLAIAIGAVVAMRWMPALTRVLRGPARPLALWWVYATMLAIWYLRPFSPDVGLVTIAEKLPIERLIPLHAYRERVDVFTVADVAVPVLLLVPLGSLLAVWPFRRTGPASGILPAIYLVFGLELAQILIAGRYFDITDVLIATAALGLGWGITRRAGFGVYGEMLSIDLSGRASAG